MTPLPALTEPHELLASLEGVSPAICTPPSSRFSGKQPLALMAGSLGLILLATALLLAAARVGYDPATAARGATPTVPQTAQVATDSPSGPTPKVEPLVFENLDADTARGLNAAMPFAPLGADRPLPLRLDSTGDAAAAFARAVDCLASAVLYEAGDNRDGQSAVAQVVLNRVRHPAFPHSVCGVVYQGKERATGCQFTFTCDGALHRQASPAAWQRARSTALAFLSGETDPRVGMATHYHTDWVHPYWSDNLDKIAQIGTHLFFRWNGGWGRKAAFKSAYAASEPIEPELAILSEAHRGPGAGGADEPLTVATADDASATQGRAASSVLQASAGDHFILVDAADNGSALALDSLSRCDGMLYCKVVGWDRRSQTYGSPANPLIRSVAFLYVRDARTGVEVVLWDCLRYNRPSESQCLSDSNRRWISFQGNLSRVS